MAKAFLDSSVVIGLLFRHAGEASACSAVIPEGDRVCSRYVSYEVARGFLRSLIALHNHSFEFTSLSGLLHAAHSGQRRFRPYEMHTWIGAFVDYFDELKRKDGTSSDILELEEMRAKLRTWIRRGWKKMEKEFLHVNDIGCREVLPGPITRADGRMDQNLPKHECGQTEACQVQTFIQDRASEIQTLVSGLSALPSKQLDKETKARIVSLSELLLKKPGENFVGKTCWKCGDALICLEAPEGQTIVTKNEKHFRPLGQILAKPIRVPKSGNIL